MITKIIILNQLPATNFKKVDKKKICDIFILDSDDWTEMPTCSDTLVYKLYREIYTGYRLRYGHLLYFLRGS